MIPNTLHAQILTMAAATLGIAACGGAAQRGPANSLLPTATEVTQSAAPDGAQASCGAKGQASCGAKGATATETKAAASCGAKSMPADAKDTKSTDRMAATPVDPSAASAGAATASPTAKPAKPAPKKNAAAHESSCGAGSCSAKK